MLPSILLYLSLLMVIVGLTVALATTCAPVRATHVSAPTTLLDEFSPDYHVHEVHSMRIAAPPEPTYAAIKAVTADEIALFGTLTWLRRLGRSGPENILNAPGRQPILDVATRTTFLLLADAPPHEVVVGTIVLVLNDADAARARAMTPAEYRNLSDPGFVKATMNFRVEPDGSGGSLLTTETRVFGTDERAMRRFLPYWRVILPGSAILRVTWLRAISRRATDQTQ